MTELVILRGRLTAIATVGDALTVENEANRLRDAYILAGKSVEEANEFAEIAVESAAVVGGILGVDVTRGGDRKSENYQSHGPDFDISNGSKNNYRTIARVEQAKRQRYYAETRDEQDMISKSGLIRFSKGVLTKQQTTGEYEWYTPEIYINAAREVMGGIDLDPASCEEANETVGAERYYTQDDDGLKQPWAGRVFCNPPYKMPEVEEFAHRMAQEYAIGEVKAGILLTNNCTDTDWWQTTAGVSGVVCLTRGRINFHAPGGKKGLATRQGQTFFYFGKDKHKFVKEFSVIGLAVEVAKCR